MPYSAVNYITFNFSAFACIAFVVFLSSSQPYFLDQVINLDPDRIGSAIGTLGAADELTAIISAPLVGALCDKINVWSSSPSSRLQLGGTKLVVLVSFFVIALALVGYGKVAHHLVPDVIFFPVYFCGWCHRCYEHGSCNVERGHQCRVSVQTTQSVEKPFPGIVAAP